MKAVRSITKLTETEYRGSEKPKHKVGDNVRIYCGSDQDHHFVIKDIRFNHDTGKFEYRRDGLGGFEWRAEGTIVSGSSRQGWHYDSQGYCDNPGRGY